MEFLPIAEGSISETTLGTDVRPWLVDLTDINAAGIALAAVGGLFAFIVIFFDQNITVRLVNAKGHHLKKGYGYDMDMMALCICTIMLSVCGCPWMVSASKFSTATIPWASSTCNMSYFVVVLEAVPGTY